MSGAGWSAPGAAYTLTGHHARGDYAAALGLWLSFSRPQQLEIISCLAAQARTQLKASGITRFTFETGIFDKPEAEAAALRLLRNEPAALMASPLDLVQIAEGLAAMSLVAVTAAGIRPGEFAEHCQHLAAAAAARC